ncbi:unnamed protein product, partial [Adineta steineri]
GFGEPLTCYQNSFDEDLLDENDTKGNDYNLRPSIFHTDFTNINSKNRKPQTGNSTRYLWRLWFCITGDTKYRSSLRKRTSRFGINSRSELDTIARIGFPASFILFNILYWFYFLHFQR